MDGTSTRGFEPSFGDSLKVWLGREFQRYLDLSVPHILLRWVSFVVLLILYCLRVYFLNGFFIVTYALGIYLLHLLIGFLSPQFDAESEHGLLLPTSDVDEFRPFQRRLPEFKFWLVFLL
jgi:hypothetical protein